MAVADVGYDGDDGQNKQSVTGQQMRLIILKIVPTRPLRRHHLSLKTASVLPFAPEKWRKINDDNRRYSHIESSRGSGRRY